MMTDLTFVLIGDTVKNLATVGAKIVIISNSSRRASTTMEKLKGLGFDPSFFSGAITSGELTHQSLQRLLLISPQLPSSLLLFLAILLLTDKCLLLTGEMILGSLH